MKLIKEAGRIKIKLEVIFMGQDLCVAIYGGDVPHLGAVAVSQARPSRDDKRKMSATTSVLTLLGHKEDEIAKKSAQYLASHTGRNVVVCCGIHLKNISKEEIRRVLQLVEELVNDLLKKIVSL